MASELCETIEHWLESNRLTWKALLTKANLTGPVGTDIRNGSTPRPETLRKLAEAMEVAPQWLFKKVGYISEEETGTEALRIDDPALELFFQGEWHKLTQAHRDFIRRLILEAKNYRANS